MIAIDATDDVVTCDRCRRIRKADLAVCPFCRLIDSLELERFTVRTAPRKPHKIPKHPRRGRL